METNGILTSFSRGLRRKTQPKDQKQQALMWCGVVFLEQFLTSSLADD